MTLITRQPETFRDAISTGYILPGRRRTDKRDGGVSAPA